MISKHGLIAYNMRVRDTIKKKIIDAACKGHFKECKHLLYKFEEYESNIKTLLKAEEIIV